MFDMSVQGLDEVLDAIDEIARTWRGNAQRAAGHVMEDMMREMKEDTPVDEGILRGTEHVVGPDWHGDTLEGAWVAGGPSAVYAIVQHEDLSLSHTGTKTKYRGGQAIQVQKVGKAKFLLDVAEARRHEITFAIQENIIEGKV